MFKTFSKFIAAAIACTFFAIMFIGCDFKSAFADKTISASTEAEKPNEQSSSADDAVNAKITGSFCATVRWVGPDYCLDDSTPNTVMLTLFQSAPFLIFPGEEAASKLEVGKTYYFEIEDTPIGSIPKSEFDKGVITEKAFVLYPIKIKAFRLAKEDEMGLNSPNLKYEIQKN
ncbi:MAG: hypothetical protein JG769_892 [Oscillospiraceae bacterium]|jgi:hypothetical protein|nr:hypothetical protein [Oscillospiraceae bacterium]